MGHATAAEKPRVVVLTDCGALDEPTEKDTDDVQSLVRFLLYANEFDVEGLVATMSWKGTLEHKILGVFPETIHAIVAEYDKVDDNLRNHNPAYPTAAHLHGIVRAGRNSGQAFWGGDHMKAVGPGMSTAASRLIVDVLKKSDSRPVWFCAWGKVIDLAQAVYDIDATHGTAARDVLLTKIRVFDIQGQDNCGAWIVKKFPNVHYMRSVNQFKGVSYLGGDKTTMAAAWIDANIRTGHGPLGAAYPDASTSHKVIEGDTPSFLWLIPTGLSGADDLRYGNWGGRFYAVKRPNPTTSTADRKETAYVPFSMYAPIQDAGDLYKPVWRWRADFQADFQARMDWCLNGCANANHWPNAVLNGQTGIDVVHLRAKPGSAVSLTAAGSSDPDGDSLSYRWFQYEDADSLGAVAIRGAGTPQATVLVPPGAAAGSEGHILLEVKDNGSPALKRYRRAVIVVDPHAGPRTTKAGPPSGD